MASSITIKVTPEILQAKARSISDQISRIERELKTIGDQITASKNYWEGDASNTHQQKYKELQDDISRVIKELKANPTNLLTMAGLYSKTENELQGTANSLPTNVIS